MILKYHRAELFGLLTVLFLLVSTVTPLIPLRESEHISQIKANHSFVQISLVIMSFPRKAVRRGDLHKASCLEGCLCWEPCDRTPSKTELSSRSCDSHYLALELSVCHGETTHSTAGERGDAGKAESTLNKDCTSFKSQSSRNFFLTLFIKRILSGVRQREAFYQMFYLHRTNWSSWFLCWRHISNAAVPRWKLTKEKSNLWPNLNNNNQWCSTQEGLFFICVIEFTKRVDLRHLECCPMAFQVFHNVGLKRVFLLSRRNL